MLQSMGSQRVGHDRVTELNRHYQPLCTKSPVPLFVLSPFSVRSSASYGLMELISVNMCSLLFFSFLIEEIQTHKKNGITNAHVPTTQFQQLVFCQSYIIYSYLPTVPFREYYKANTRYCPISSPVLGIFCLLLPLFNGAATPRSPAGFPAADGGIQRKRQSALLLY